MQVPYAKRARATTPDEGSHDAKSRKMNRRAYLAAEREFKKASRYAVLSRIVGIDVAPIGVSPAEDAA